MISLRKTFRVVICFAAVGCASGIEPEIVTASSDLRIGVYDSRAIAVAAVGSEYYTHHIKPLEDAYQKAKAEGNEELIKELEPRIWAQRKQTHRQGFSTAPVDDILEYIKDDLPEITKKAGVGPILSKWDKEALSQHKSAKHVDITMRLVAAFKPKEQSLKWAIEIQNKPPIPMEELEEHMANEGH